MITPNCDVAIIGAGPSGLSAANRLRELGIKDVVLIEREAMAGGVPRHCGHSPFGMREFKRVLSGKQYADKLTNLALKLGVQLLLNTTVVKINENGVLELSSFSGVQSLKANKVLICTGCREMPRSTRLVSGDRPMGVLTTGALQSIIYSKQALPFKRPVIIGSETVSFSAILSCRHAGMRPVAMIEANPRITAMQIAKWLPKTLGIELLTNTSLQAIHGRERVESVTLKNASGNLQTIQCDGVIFSGKFVAEASLAKMGHLEIDRLSGGPVIDQYYRCSNPNYFACGNMVHPVDTAGWCWAEGKHVADLMAANINGILPAANKRIAIRTDNTSIKYFTPQQISLPDLVSASLNEQIQIRVAHAASGQLSLQDASQSLVSIRANFKPEKRVLLSLPLDEISTDSQSLSLQLQQA